jgi:casein kinase II subunit beta
MAAAGDGMFDSSSSDFSDDETCIEWLLSQEGNHILCRIEEDYIEDNFNLYGLNKIIPNFRESIRLLLSDAQSVEGCLSAGWTGPPYQHLLDLYGLIHARYIVTTQGLNKMRRKFQNNVFGQCPDEKFGAFTVLPVGLSDQLRSGVPQGYCPQSGEVYKMPAWGEFLDGAYFGTTFPHLLLMQNPALHGPEGFPVQGSEYIPRIFGFKVRRPDADFVPRTEGEGKKKAVKRKTEAPEDDDSW